MNRPSTCFSSMPKILGFALKSLDQSPKIVLYLLKDRATDSCSHFPAFVTMIFLYCLYMYLQAHFIFDRKILVAFNANTEIEFCWYNCLDLLLEKYELLVFPVIYSRNTALRRVGDRGFLYREPQFSLQSSFF